MKLTDDQLRSEILLLSHHLDDIEEGLAEQDLDYVRRGVKDIREIVGRLAKALPKETAREIERISDDVQQIANLL